MGVVLNGARWRRGCRNQVVQRGVVIRSDGCRLREVCEILTSRSQQGPSSVLQTVTQGCNPSYENVRTTPGIVSLPARLISRRKNRTHFHSVPLYLLYLRRPLSSARKHQLPFRSCLRCTCLIQDADEINVTFEGSRELVGLLDLQIDNFLIKTTFPPCYKILEKIICYSIAFLLWRTSQYF